MSFWQGLSEYTVAAAAENYSEAEATRSVIYDAANPDAYKARAFILLQKGRYQEAIKDLNQAIALRPEDYLLWLQLGFANYQTNNFADAQNAYDQASHLAPRYAKTEQYFGYLFLKQNNLEQSFFHFRRSAALDPAFFSETVNLARQKFGNDAEAIERAVQPSSLDNKKQLASYFMSNEMMSRGILFFLTGKDLDDKSKIEFISRLIEKKDFSFAYKIWTSQSDHPAEADDKSIINGGFENEINGAENNFGWRFKAEKNIALSIEGANAFSGAANLKIKFNGNSDPATIIISNLSIATSNQKYRLEFATHSLKLISGGLPFIQITDADSGRLLGQSISINSEGHEWQKYKIDFMTGGQTEAVIITVRRQNCFANPCPAFGDLWIDDFELKRI